MKCRGCGQVKLISVAVSRDGMGREKLAPSPCEDCRLAKLKG